MGELVRVHLEENEVPGVASVADGGSKNIVCVTTPRVIHDIRTSAGSNWKEVQEYAGSAENVHQRSWYVRRRPLHQDQPLAPAQPGAAVAQSTLDANTVPGQGAAMTVDQVYTVGQPNSTRTVPVAAGGGAGFSVGMYVTIHSSGSGHHRPGR